MLDRSAIAPISVAAMLMATVLGVQAQGASTFPDWSGQWSRVPDGGVPRYDPTKPIRKQEAPLKPEYQARFEASMRDQDVGGQGLDMAYSCRPPGMPRIMTTIDNSLTRPWTVAKNYQRAQKVWWGENNCVEGQRWVTIGKEVYFLSG